MIFEVQGKTDNYVELVKDGDGVEFLSSRYLVEYEIQTEDLQVQSVKNISVATVKIVFRRQMFYYVLSTFLQVRILFDTISSYGLRRLRQVAY